MNESREDAARTPGTREEPLARRRPHAQDLSDGDRLRGSGSAAGGHVEAGEASAEMEEDLERRESEGGSLLHRTEFDIARLPPD